MQKEEHCGAKKDPGADSVRMSLEGSATNHALNLTSRCVLPELPGRTIRALGSIARKRTISSPVAFQSERLLIHMLSSPCTFTGGARIADWASVALFLTVEGLQ